jgi:hypothetical protein
MKATAMVVPEKNTSPTVILRLVFAQRRKVASRNQKENTHMSFRAELATIIGALLFFTIVVVVGLAFIAYIESANEKTITHGLRRRSLT